MVSLTRRLLLVAALGVAIAFFAALPKRTSSSISFTSTYTGHTWIKYGLSDPALETSQGRVLHALFMPIERALSFFSLPTLNGMLLSRHHSIDSILHSHVSSGRVGAVIEVAAGLSPRGLRFTRQYPALYYVECDLPSVASQKLSLLTSAGLLPSGSSSAFGRHVVLPVDALAVSSSPDSIAAVARSALTGKLPAGQGVAIVTEGLVQYFSPDVAATIWENVATALRQFPAGGVYVSDLNLDSENGSSVLESFFKWFLSLLVRGKVHFHFAGVEEAESKLIGYGFTTAHLHDPEDILDRSKILLPFKAAKVKIIEATTGNVKPTTWS